VDIRYNRKYRITGTLKSGKRFKPIDVPTIRVGPVWNGAIWLRVPGRKRMRLYKEIKEGKLI